MRSCAECGGAGKVTSKMDESCALSYVQCTNCGKRTKAKESDTVEKAEELAIADWDAGKIY